MLDKWPPIANRPFGSDSAPVDVSGVVNADLERSGYFKMLDEQAMPNQPSTASAINFKEWQGLGQNYMVIGQVLSTGPGQYSVQFQLFDVYKSIDNK